MADPFVGEIRLFAGNFAPTGWAFCQGQLLPLSQNTALFSLLGTQYGGDGRTTFALPDLRERTPVQHGQGPGLSLLELGEAPAPQSRTVMSDVNPARGMLANKTVVAHRLFPAVDAPYLGLNYIIALQGVFPPRG